MLSAASLVRALNERPADSGYCCLGFQTHMGNETVPVTASQPHGQFFLQYRRKSHLDFEVWQVASLQDELVSPLQPSTLLAEPWFRSLTFSHWRCFLLKVWLQLVFSHFVWIALWSFTVAFHALVCFGRPDFEIRWLTFWDERQLNS